MSDAEDLNATLEQALRWLARREYARAELQRRLRAKGHQADHIDTALQRLQDNGLQSDERFTESFIRSRRQRGYGPLRIRAELHERGVDKLMISDMLDPDDDQWHHQATDALLKRFPEPPTDIRERARRERFLRYRGFVQQQVSRAMSRYPDPQQ